MICASVEKSDGVKASLIKPEENLIILENGKEIEYDVLMLATGIDQDYDSIPGLMEGLQDAESNIYNSKDFAPRKVRSFFFEFGLSRFKYSFLLLKLVKVCYSNQQYLCFEILFKRIMLY